MRETVLYSAWLLIRGVFKKVYVWFTGIVLASAEVYERFLKSQLPPPYQCDIPMVEWFPYVAAFLVVCSTIHVYHELRMRKLALETEVSQSGIAELKAKLPRELTAEQKSIIVEGLRQNKECSVSIHLLTNDIVSDGASYAANFQSAFEEAGWHAMRLTPHPDDRDYESGVWIVGKGEGEPPTIDILEALFEKAKVDAKTKKTDYQNIELIIGKRA